MQKRVKTLPFLMVFLLHGTVHATSCSVSSNPVTFGTYNVYASQNMGSTGYITVNCNPANSPYSIALNQGLHGTVTNRLLKRINGTDTLPYNLYTDSAKTIIWGQGSSNGVIVSGTSATPIPVYGAITPLQDVSVGLYTDNVTITVTF